MGKEETNMGTVTKGCDFRVVDPEHDSLWMIPCGEPVVRDGKCEKHKVERRKSLYSDRRVRGSSDTSPSCGNGLCRVEFGHTRHDTRCEDYGPGWA